MTSVLIHTFAAVTILMLVVWGLSVLRRDASIVDVFWGLGFVLVALVAHRSSAAHTARGTVMLFCVSLWGVRLAAYLSARNWGKEEDYRYQAMRRHYGDRFWLVSLVTVFALQGALMWVISLPVQSAIAAPQPDRLTLLDVAGVVVWLVGLAFEAVGDWQLARFKRDPRNRGKVMTRGLWRYTRHPNYFGDALLWWGLYLIAAATPLGRWFFVSPLLMTGLLMRVSGVPLLERRMMKTRPEYRDYMEQTSAFVPSFPKIQR